MKIYVNDNNEIVYALLYDFDGIDFSGLKEYEVDFKDSVNFQDYLFIDGKFVKKQ